jgi:hypothetical protein
MKKSGLADSPLFSSQKPKNTLTPPPPLSIVESSKNTGVRTTQRTNEPTFERKSESSNARKTKKRVQIRHTFDIYQDQLRSLHTLQLEAIRAGKKKPKLGKLVQKALDQYLKEAKQ